jgi:hypothetical protein
VTQSAPANLRGQRDLGEILSYAWMIYLRNFPAFFAVALIAAPMALLTTIVVRRIDDAATAQTAGLWLQAAAAIVELVAIAGLIRAVDDVAGGGQPDAGRSIDAGLQKFWTLFTAQLLAGVHILAALLAVPFLAIYWRFNREATIDGRRDWYFAVIPFALSIYLIIRWYFVSNAVVVRDARSWGALDDSAAAVRGTWWRTFGIVLLIFLVRVVPALVIAGATAYAHPVIDGIAAALIVALILPFAVAAQTLLYYDLKARHALDDARPAGIDDPEPDLPREGA